MIQVLEKFKQNKAVEKICNFQNSIWYVLCLAVIVLVSHLSGFELPFIWIVVIATAFIFVMQEDLKPFVPTVLLLYFCIPRAHGSTGWADIGIWQTTPYIINLCLIGAVFLAAFLFNFIYYKQYRNFKKITFLTAGLAAFAVSYLTSGLFAPDYTVKNFGYGLTFALLYYVFYLLIFCTVKWKKGESMRYLAQCMVVMGLLISVELAFLYMLNPDLHGVVVDKMIILLGWGNSNSIAFTTLLCLPFAFWLAWKEKYSLLYFLAATVMVTAIFFTYARGSLVVAGPMYLIGTVFLCFVAKRRPGVWIAAGCFLIAAIIIAFCFKDWMLNKLHIYIEYGMADHGRFWRWEASIEGFKKAPVFGMGQYYLYGQDPSSLFFWAHNTILQIMATLGIFGLAAYLFHRAQTVYMFVKKPTSARLFAGLAILGILIAGMFDMVMICQNVILYYGIILAFAEKDFLCSVGKMDENGVWLNRKKEKAGEQAAAVAEGPQAPTEPQKLEEAPQTPQAPEQENT